MEEESTLRQWIRTIVEQTLEEEELNEFSGVGAVAGYTLPLGMAPNHLDVQKKRKTRKDSKKKK
jgi:hypothetical protein